MNRRDVETDILDRLEAFDAGGGRLPRTSDGKVNVQKLCKDLGLPPSDSQHFYRKARVKDAVNAIAAAQGLLPVGARASPEGAEAVIEERLRNADARARGDALAAVEAGAAVAAMAEELRAARAEAAALRLEKEALVGRLRLVESGIVWEGGC